jgi:glycosyltransferase involved in cell wall biosynthesis
MSAQNILLIIPNLGAGGAQKVYYQQLRLLQEDNRIIGCVFNFEGMVAEENVSNIISLDVPAGKNFITKAYFFLLRIRRLSKLKERMNIDLSISHLEGADYVNILSKHREEVIIWIHGTKQHDKNIQGMLGWIRKQVLMPLIYQRADKIVTVSKGISFELSRNYPRLTKKIFSSHNALDISEIQTKAKAIVSLDFVSLCSKKTTLITHCRLARQKNIAGMIEVFSVLDRSNNDIKLIILGDGELRESLLQQCVDKNLKVYSIWGNCKWGDHYDIYFLGMQRNPFFFLQHATLYLMTSDWEGYPLSLCEAMACALPVLASDCFTGPREIVAPDLNEQQPLTRPIVTSTGVLMPLVDSVDNQLIWAKKIRSVIDDAKLRHDLSENALMYAQNFDEEEVKIQWRKIIE